MAQNPIGSKFFAAPFKSPFRITVGPVLEVCLALVPYVNYETGKGPWPRM